MEFSGLRSCAPKERANVERLLAITVKLGATSPVVGLVLVRLLVSP
jgi:hypothetical protein